MKLAEKLLTKIREKSIGTSGIARVEKYLKKEVEAYIKELDPASDDSQDYFFVQDFAKWHKKER